MTARKRPAKMRYDPVDAALVESRSWWLSTGRKTFYAWTVGEGRKQRYLHREIGAAMIGRELTVDEHVDHANGDGLDNRRCNLRIVSPSTNILNRVTANRNNTSGFRAVFKDHGRWTARVKVGYTNHALGTYKFAEDAARVVEEFLAHGVRFV